MRTRMKIRLAFDYLSEPLSASIDGDWEEIVCIAEIDVSVMFADPTVAQTCRDALSRFPNSTWIVNPYWDPMIGWTRAPRPIQGVTLSEALRTELQRLQAIFQSTYNDDYPPDSGFKSALEESQFQEATRTLAEQLKSHWGPAIEFEFRA